MIRLIPEWRKAWRFSSVQAATVLFFLSLIQADVLPHVQPLVPPQHWPWVSGGLALAIAVFRLLAQAGLSAPKDPQA